MEIVNKTSMQAAPEESQSRKAFREHPSELSICVVGPGRVGRRYVDPRNWNEALEAFRFAADFPATSGGTV